jgi:hypothetical protein
LVQIRCNYSDNLCYYFDYINNYYYKIIFTWKTTTDDEYENDFDLKHFNKYLIHWQWFVLAMCIGFTRSFLYLRYTIPQYHASTILVKDEKKGGCFRNFCLADFRSGGMKSNLDNEIEI